MKYHIVQKQKDMLRLIRPKISFQYDEALFDFSLIILGLRGIDSFKKNSTTLPTIARIGRRLPHLSSSSRAL